MAGWTDTLTGFGSSEGVGRYRWLIAVFAILLVVLIIMSVAGVGFDIFGGATTGRKPEERIFWKKWDPLIPLRINQKEIGNGLAYDRYTLLVDMVWVNTRVTEESSLYRHILHRGSGEGADFLQRTQPSVRDAAAAAAGPSAVGPTRTEILQRMPQGLPIRMNPGIMADPMTNDMLIFIDTEFDHKNYRESVRIPDIPMDQPFRLAVIVMPNMVEVYINCQLEVTKMLEGRPRQVEVPWYGLIGPQPLNAAIQNLRLFNGIMGPAWLRPYCAKAPEFPDTVGTCQKVA